MKPRSRNALPIIFCACVKLDRRFKRETETTEEEEEEEEDEDDYGLRSKTRESGPSVDDG